LEELHPRGLGQALLVAVAIAVCQVDRGLDTQLREIGEILRVRQPSPIEVVVDSAEIIDVNGARDDGGWRRSRFVVLGIGRNRNRRGNDEPCNMTTDREVRMKHAGTPKKELRRGR